MVKRTINEAIIAVLREAGKPLSSKDIYIKILERNYYKFQSTNAAGVVSNQIRRHCEGNKQSEKREVLYRKLPGGQFDLLQNSKLMDRG